MKNNECYEDLLMRVTKMAILAEVFSDLDALALKDNDALFVKILGYQKFLGMSSKKIWRCYFNNNKERLQDKIFLKKVFGEIDFKSEGFDFLMFTGVDFLMDDEKLLREVVLKIKGDFFVCFKDCRELLGESDLNGKLEKMRFFAQERDDFFLGWFNLNPLKGSDAIKNAIKKNPLNYVYLDDSDKCDKTVILMALSMLFGRDINVVTEIATRILTNAKSAGAEIDIELQREFSRNGVWQLDWVNNNAIKGFFDFSLNSVLRGKEEKSFDTICANKKIFFNDKENVCYFLSSLVSDDFLCEIKKERIKNNRPILKGLGTIFSSMLVCKEFNEFTQTAKVLGGILSLVKHVRTGAATWALFKDNGWDDLKKEVNCFSLFCSLDDKEKSKKMKI